jgi:hypothetical protein
VTGGLLGFGAGMIDANIRLCGPNMPGLSQVNASGRQREDGSESETPSTHAWVLLVQLSAQEGDGLQEEDDPGSKGNPETD